jgi:hypothetical protein
MIVIDYAHIVSLLLIHKKTMMMIIMMTANYMSKPRGKDILTDGCILVNKPKETHIPYIGQKIS